MDSCNVIFLHQNFPDDYSVKWGTHFFNEHFIRKGCNVLNLVHATSILQLMKPNKEKLHRLRLSMKGSYTAQEKNIGSYTVCGITTLFRPVESISIFHNSFVTRHYFSVAYPSIKKITQSLGKIGILFFSIVEAGIYYQVRANLSILRVQDMLDSSFYRLDCAYYKDMVDQVDIILAVSNPIYDMAVKQRGTSGGVYLLPNGCDIGKFLIKHPVPLEYENIPRPIALYVGGIYAGHFDWDLLINLAKKRPDISFVLIGRANNIVDLPKNVYILGYRHHDELPAYMQHAQIGLIPLCDTPMIRAMERPLKFYEYIASGLPVITVSYGAMKAMAPQAILANTPEEFSDGIDQVLGYTLQQRQSLQEFSKQFSWENVFKRFDEIISLHYSDW